MDSKQDLKNGREEDTDRVLYHVDLPYIPKKFCIEMISQYNNNLLVRYFGFKKTQRLVARKYYWPILRVIVKSYIKDCNIYLVSNLVKHKL